MQINLVVGDYFKSDASVLAYTDVATELITWLRSRTILINTIQDQHKAIHGFALAVIRAVLTRWTAHYLAYSHLLTLHSTICLVLDTDYARPAHLRLIFTGDSKTMAKTNNAYQLVKNNEFWISIARMVRHLEPLAISANVTQATVCRLDEVLLTFGWLVMKYTTMRTLDPEDYTACTAIISSLEKRWSNAVQEPFIAAVILNPFYQTRPFRPLPALNRMNTRVMMERLYQRIMRENPPPAFVNELAQYLSHQGIYEDIERGVSFELRDAQENVGIFFFSTHFDSHTSRLELQT
ncbi:hypothetical protein OF83DRAFT_1070358 [Amylostereum chailletii]|nr:hypothetical protein OF83DRAFT_1070358 [Amylostereum chailletii]